MFIIGLLSWWYSAGLMSRFLVIRERIASASDYFSIGLLATTLFAPFRQISAAKVDGPIGVKWRAFLDRLISRVIGAIVRFIMIVIGSISIVGLGLGGIVAIVFWLFIPLLPIIGGVMMVIGWVPEWN